MLSSSRTKFIDYLTLNESFKNLFSAKEKKEYAEEVFSMLQNSYKGIGGLKGSGFDSPQDMIKNVPMWKLSFSEGVLIAVVMYKDKNGRKLVALGASTVPKYKDTARKTIKSILTVEFKRSFSEISGPLLAYMEKRLPEVLNKFKIKATLVPAILNKEIVQIDDYYYSRKIGSDYIKKLAIGTTNKPII